MYNIQFCFLYDLIRDILRSNTYNLFIIIYDLDCLEIYYKLDHKLFTLNDYKKIRNKLFTYLDDNIKFNDKINYKLLNYYNTLTYLEKAFKLDFA